MSVYFDKAKGRFRFTFNRVINGRSIRATKLLPEAWSAAEADAFDAKETARIYAEQTGVGKERYLITDAIKIYMEEHIGDLKSKQDYIREYANLYYLYAGKTLDELPAVCSEIRKLKRLNRKGEVLGDLAPATKRSKIRYLTAACNYAYKYHNMGEHRPSDRVVVPQVKNERHVYPTRKEMLLIARKCDRRDVRAGIICAFYSGMRQGEIRRAVPNKGNFELYDTKNDDVRFIPVHPKLNVYMKQFPLNIKRSTFARCFERARAKAGLPHIHFHDKRHSAASEMINAGVDLYTVGRVLGHKDARSTKRYSHLLLDTLKKAVDKIGQK